MDFINLKVEEGLPLDRAVIEAGAIRFRPMLDLDSATIEDALAIVEDSLFDARADSGRL